MPGIPKLMVLGLGLSQLWEWIRANRVRYRSAAMTQDKQTAASQKESTGVAEFRACDERLYPSRIMTIKMDIRNGKEQPLAAVSTGVRHVEEGAGPAQANMPSHIPDRTGLAVLTGPYC